MRVTIIDGDVPYPATSGKRLRTLNLLLPLADQHEITFIGRSPTPDTRLASQYLADHGITPIFVHSPLPERSGPRFAKGLAANLLSPLPYNVDAHRCDAMREAVQCHARKARVDVWQLEWTGYDYCLDGDQRPVVLQAHNIDALIWQRYFETETRPAHKAYIWHQYRKQKRHEAASFKRATTVVAVSEDDGRLARKLYGDLPIEVVANGVDTAFFGSIKRATGSRTILFLGALDWRPNLDGLTVMLDSIFPALRALCPDAKLMIVGRNPPDSLARKVAKLEGVELHANVPDVRPFIAQAAALAVPLRIGGGSRLKILEALASGLPVVSTAIGAEGLMLQPDTHYRLAEAPLAFAHALSRCIDHPDAERQLAGTGRRFVAEHNGWPFLSGRLEHVWAAAMTRDADRVPARGQRIGASSHG